jgi:nicotinamidase-related amidase
MSPTPTSDRIDTSRTALIAYDVCRRALTPADPTRRAAMTAVLDAWVTLIAACRAKKIPVIYTTPVSRADGADVVLLPTDLSELLRLLKRSAIVIGGGATNRGVETSVREAFSMDLDTVVVRECCWGGDAKAHAYSLDTSMKMYARVRTLAHALSMLA